MFLKKKQTDSETGDVLQQIKKKISDTGNNGGGDAQNQSSEQALVLQDLNDDDYSDEDSELLNMLLSDDDDEDNEDEVNDLLNNNNDSVGVSVDKHDSDSDIVNIAGDMKMDEANENIALSSVNNDVDDDDNEEERVDQLGEYDGDGEHKNDNDKDNLGGFVVDGLLNDIRSKIKEEQEHKNSGVDAVSGQFHDEDGIDEDDIEFYDRNNNKIEEGGSDKNEVDDAEELDHNEDDEEIDETDNLKKLMDEDDTIDNDDALNTSFSEELLEDMATGADVRVGNKQQVSTGVSDVLKREAVEPLYNIRQKNRKISKAFDTVAVNDSTKKNVRKNISNLIEEVKRQVVDERRNNLNMVSGGKTLEQIVIGLIQPVIIDYLNNNLERIVSDIVNEEIKQITDNIDE